jgi:hypothetical protein
MTVDKNAITAPLQVFFKPLKDLLVRLGIAFVQERNFA